MVLGKGNQALAFLLSRPKLQGFACLGRVVGPAGSLQVGKWIAGILKLRAKTLREGIGALLEDPNFQNLAGEFYAHPLVTGLTQKGKNSLPSYISAGVFVDALLDIVSPKDAEPKPPVEVYRSVVEQITNLSQTNSAFGRTLVSLISSAGITRHSRVW